MPDDYMQPNALATSFKGGQPGQGLKMHFVTKKGQDRAMIRVGGSSFFLNVAELNKLVLSIEEHSDFIKTHRFERDKNGDFLLPEPPKDYSDADEDCPSQDSSTCAGCGNHAYCCCTCKPEDL